MLVITGIFDNERFIPDRPVSIPQKKKVTVTIEEQKTLSPEIEQKLAAFRQLTEEVKELNKTDPLPPEFDEILSQRMQFRETAVL